MRWVVCALLIAGCDQGRTPAPAPKPAATPRTSWAESFVELEEQTISDISVSRDWRRIKITADGTLTDEREQQPTRQRHISPRQFLDLVEDLEGVGFLSLSPCMMFDHGQHTTLTLSVPEGHNRIGDATTCDVLREPIRHILDLAD